MLKPIHELGLGLHFSVLLNLTLNLGVSGWGLGPQGQGCHVHSCASADASRFLHSSLPSLLG